jgi:transmembrane 9 superfamily protein 2/4
MSTKDIIKLQSLITKDYRVNWLLDGLPVTTIQVPVDSPVPDYLTNSPYADGTPPTGSYIARGFPVGFHVTPDFATPDLDQGFYLNNHIRVVVRYHKDPILFKGSRIVGFEAKAFSVDHVYNKDKKSKDKDIELATCTGAKEFKFLKISEDRPSKAELKRMKKSKKDVEKSISGREVVFTYNVIWVHSAERWATRWDVYLNSNPDDEIHYFSIANSFLVLLLLTTVVGMIILRTLRRDINQYNDLETVEEMKEETGWKLVHSDVFRPPSFSPMLLSILVGGGVQIGVLITIICMCFLAGFISPLDEGKTLTTIIMVYVFSAAVSGYSSARVYKFMQGKAWKRNTIATATVIPGFVISLFMILDMFLWSAGASTAVSFVTVFVIFLLWVGVSTPLIFVGSYFGFKQEAISVPLKTNRIARHIPEQPWWTNPLVLCLVGGILPFGSVCLELFFIMSALWLHQVYYVFGFLIIVLFIVVATCAEVAIVVVYILLCNEDYRWHWVSFLTCASSSFYIFAYSLWYFNSQLEILGFTSTLVYVVYSGMIAVVFGLFCGSIGFCSGLIFVRQIYSAVKVD